MNCESPKQHAGFILLSVAHYTTFKSREGRRPEMCSSLSHPVHLTNVLLRTRGLQC